MSSRDRQRNQERNSHTDDIYSNCIRSYLEENRALKEEIRAIKSENKKIKQENSKIKGDLAENQRRISILKQKNASSQKNFTELSRQNENLAAEANQRISELTEELQKSRREVSDLKNQVFKLNEVQKQLLSAHHDYAARLEDAESELRSTKEALSVAINHNDELEHACSVKDRQLNELSATCDDYSSKCQTLQTKVKFGEKMMQEQLSVVDGLRYRVSSIEEVVKNEDLQSKDVIIDSLRRSVKAGEDKCAAITEALRNSQEKIQNFYVTDREMQTLRDEHSVLLKRAEDAEECARQFEREIQEKNRLYTETISKQNDSIANLSEKLFESQKEKDHYQSLASSMENKYKDLEETVEKISTKVSGASSERSSPKRVTFPEDDSYPKTSINISSDDFDL